MGSILGTTFSGKTLNTTFGNSMRSFCYHKYILHRAKVFGIPIVVGDDFVVVMNKRDTDLYLKEFRNVYHIGEQPEGDNVLIHGLG